MQYSNQYPNGSAMRIGVCNRCDLVHVVFSIPGMQDAPFVLGQNQAQELAYGLMKSINVTMHKHINADNTPEPVVPKIGEWWKATVHVSKKASVT